MSRHTLTGSLAANQRHEPVGGLSTVCSILRGVPVNEFLEYPGPRGEEARQIRALEE